MRINRYVALATGLSRRKADELIEQEAVAINGKAAKAGQGVSDDDEVTLNGKHLFIPKPVTVMLNKPRGYVCSRRGQGSKTIYDLLPPELHSLKTIGRLDKDSSGLILLTNDGELSQNLSHPSFSKAKVYEVELNKPLNEADRKQIEKGVKLEDGTSKLQLEGRDKHWVVTMHEGRNRQIRRTFGKLGYPLKTLHRTSFGPYKLKELNVAKYKIL